ncbi:hypothetical protein FJT64_023971 [Amphibalanus amphitrite]|uniref:Uncharacterized protein n=1 Tax=Amphibalanus amphitrite TaxID=1232801 RepID=A0A6A4WDY8_AMPAM|nr:hypothetical protein FJT64_023971 [Amphibalanus amphitrite]
MLSLTTAVTSEEPRCKPAIQLNNTSSSGQTLLLRAELEPYTNGSYPERHLQLRYQARPRDVQCNHSDGWDIVNGLGSTPEFGNQLEDYHTVHLAGCYQVRCCTKSGGPCYSSPVDQLWVDGINYTLWNVTISAQQVAGTQLSVEITKQMDPSSEHDFYLPVLRVMLYQVAPIERYVNSGVVEFPGNRSLVFGRDGGLSPGPYRIEVRPINTSCGPGGSCQARYLPHNITAPEAPSAGLVVADPTTGRTLHVTLGALAAVLTTSLVVFLCYRFRSRKTVPADLQKQPLPAYPPLTESICVFLLHRGGDDASLVEVRSRLRAAGVVVLDAGSTQVRNLMHTYTSPADLLALELLRNAKLLFVGGGSDRPDRIMAQMYENMLRFVRNGQLGLDYGRVFTATLSGSEDGDELAGLVAGRLFRLPTDGPALVEHIRCAGRPAVERLSSTESDCVDQPPPAV